VSKGELEWRRENGVLTAYKAIEDKRPMRFSTGRNTSPPWVMFAQIKHVYQHGTGVGYCVLTNDWGNTGVPADSEYEAKQIINAMWALET
jgi:hypothetical protein